MCRNEECLRKITYKNTRESVKLLMLLDIFVGILSIGLEDMDWIDVAHDRDTSWALVSSVMFLRVP
jgi:hypothetical protein